jgi:inner membrane protein
MGLKLFVVCALALALAIPGLFIWALVDDRSKSASDVVKEISDDVGGQQTFLGPTLAIPYSLPVDPKTHSQESGVYIVFPARASAAVKITTEERHRSLFKVPVFQAEMKFDAAFDLTGVPAEAPPDAALDWSQAEIVVGVSDARGALADATLTVDGKTSPLAPSSVTGQISIGAPQLNSSEQGLTLMGGKAASFAKPNGQFSVSSVLRFSGAQRIAVLAYGKTTQLSMQGDWPNPSFDGGILPISKTLSASGFSASWSVPYIARGVHAEGGIGCAEGLNKTALGVSFPEVADPYQSVTRSLKYVLLFLGLVFLSFFIFEVTTAKRVHPAQYVLVGIAQIIFYLLLLSLAERIGFDWGFLVAGSATVILLATNAGWVFASRAQGVKALAIFSLLYGLIYLLLRLEDNALLVGAVASFIAVAIAMYFTRGIDWYGSSTPARSQQSNS